MREISSGLWTMRFPLKLAGMNMGRTVTLMQLGTRDIVIHSTAPFSSEDVKAITSLGRVSAIVEAMLFHDTYAKEAKTVFPDVPYYAPEGFERITGVQSIPLSQVPSTWCGELEALELEGMPKVREHVFLHRPSRTLIVADLFFNIGPSAGAWTQFFFRHVVGVKTPPGISRIFRKLIADREAFKRSAQTMMAWDFDRLIVGHGEIVESGAKAKVEAALKSHGY